MTEAGFIISDLIREARVRWLKPPEVFFILQNHEEHMISNEAAQMPTSGSLFLYNKKVNRFFRRDGHSWRKKRGGRTLSEAHERLKVGNEERLNCYYAHGEQSFNFQRRSYWMLDSENDHIVLVHYRDIHEGGNYAGSVSQVSPASHSSFSQGLGSSSTQQHGSSGIVGESLEQYHNQPSPLSMEMSSTMNYADNLERTEEESGSSDLEMSQALRRIEEQLSLNEDGLKDIFYNDDQDADMGNISNDPSSSVPPAGYISQSQHQLEDEMKDWKSMLDGSKNSVDNVSQVRDMHKINKNDSLLSSSIQGEIGRQSGYTWLNFAGNISQKSSVPVVEVTGDFKCPVYSSEVSSYVYGSNNYRFFQQGPTGISFEDNLSLTISQKQKFTIREISPEWGFASEATKVFIIGSFLCDPSESTWTCMFGDLEVPAQIIQDGVICCHAPPHLPGKVALCVTSANRESCSEVREFDYRLNPSICQRCIQAERDAFRSPDEVLLLVRFVQLLLSAASSTQKGDSSELAIDLLGKLKTGEDSWDQVIESLLLGSSTLTVTTNWLLQELLKDKLQNWLTSRSEEASSLQGCSLSKKEQGIIHIIAGLGFEWALHPVLKTGVSVNFRDINGWTALHWAARFGREKMVAALIACGALAGAVTDPTPQDPTGKTAGSIAETFGHKGLAGYLSEQELTSHLLSLTLKESELFKGTAYMQAERTLCSVPETNPISSEDHLSLKDTLAAVRNAAQAAARIQSAFRAHSFRKRQQRKEVSGSSSLNEYGLLPSEMKELTAALSIQKKYRGWKGRKDFLALRKKVVKIQAHVRGYQVRNNYNFCWAVGILEKVVLRWRRRGIGLRGFKNEIEVVDEDDEEDILKVFRKQKVDASIDKAVSRVLSMVESPGARQQYRRLLEKYRQAKAELKDSENEEASPSS